MSKDNTNKAKKKLSGGAVAGIVIGGIVVLLALVYLFFCWWAGWHALPGSDVRGVDTGGVKITQLDDRLETLTNQYKDRQIVLACRNEQASLDLDKAGLELNMPWIYREATAQEQPFLLRGASWVKAWFVPCSVETNLFCFSEEDYAAEVVEQLQNMLDKKALKNEITVEEEEIVIRRGEPGMAIDMERAMTDIYSRLDRGSSTELELQAELTSVEEIDFNAVHEMVKMEAADATLDPETYEVIPHVNAVTFDIPQAEKLFAAAADGSVVKIPLIITEPEMTTEEYESLLFADVLGQAYSWISGTVNRLSNVRLAGSMCHDTVLMPGDTFSYWDKIAPCNAEQGFLPAPTYLKGESVDGVGGGICQMSSSIYYAAFHANLEVVERNQHSFAVGYLPDGGDAMVSEGWSDFKFKNNTEYPIKIVVYVSGRNLTVQILGTKTDDTYVRMEANRLSTTEFKTIYEVDPEVPAGTTKVDVTPYTGRKVEVYRLVYDGQGKLISRTFESTNNYKKRDQIILVNPADAYKYGLDENGNPLPEGTPVVTPTPTPTPVPPPVDTPAVPTTTPDASAPPAVETTPVPTPTPETPPAQDQAGGEAGAA